MLGAIVTGLKSSSLGFRSKWWLLQNVVGVPFDTGTEPEPDEYDRNKKRSGFAARDGRVYKSSGERAIANWLLSAAVDFEYERSYEVDVADAQHAQYRPDFYYPGANLYHEHWAFIPGEQVPPSFAGYLESAAWKRETHTANQTKLIETAAFQLSDGTLLASLEEQLRAHGLDPQFDPDRLIPGQPLVSDDDLLRLFRIFLTHAKSNRLSDEDLRVRASRGGIGRATWRESLFLDLFADVRAEWDRCLRAADEIDFEDMLNLATDLIENGKWTSPYRVVLVDEFQDASHARARLVKALVAAPDRYLFAVGDDWQSIYRFAGSDISAMTKFEDTFGRGHILRLERTFRNSQELSTIAADFVMKNPVQLKKKVWSTSAVVDPVSLAIVDDDAGVTRAIGTQVQAIAAGLGPRDTAVVKVLGRYRFEGDLVPRNSFPGVRVEFQTIHSSKGLEADHVIVPGMNRSAFPSAKEDDPLLRLAMPDGDGFPFAEERRLFYVALTRSRGTVHLIARRGRESDFVTELISAGVFDPRRTRRIRPSAPAGVSGLRTRSDGRTQGTIRHLPRL
ncbi:MAG: UvrD-helicase domain-containing protein [Galbitalea sp.]